MNDWQILLIEGDPQRGAQVSSLLASANHSTIAVPNFNEASEALCIQRFDVILVGSGQTSAALSSFVAFLQELKAGQRTGSRVPLLSYSPGMLGESAFDAHLPADFLPTQLPEILAGLSARPAEADASIGLNFPILSVFEPAQFEEQCANETELMVEILDLFQEESARELPEMAAAVAEADFDRVSLIAHTMKGSLGTLHAPLARERAQELETAARRKDGVLCAAVLERLEDDLRLLAEPLARFREACLHR